MSDLPVAPAPNRRALFLGLASAGGIVCLAAAIAGFGARVPASPELAYAFSFIAVSVQIAAAGTLWGTEGGKPLAHRPLWYLGLSLLPLALLVHGEPLTLGRMLVINTAILYSGTLLGALLGRRIEIAGHVLAVALISAIVDTWSVFDEAGPSGQMAASVLRDPTRASALVLSFPLLGSGAFAPLIGAGDAVFAGLYGAALGRHGIALWRVGVALCAGLVVGMLTTLWLGRPLPLLPFMGTAVLCTDRKLSSLGSRDRRTLLISVGVLAVWVASRIAR